MTYSLGIGTSLYIAPEVAISRSYNEKVSDQLFASLTSSRRTCTHLGSSSSRCALPSPRVWSVPRCSVPFGCQQSFFRAVGLPLQSLISANSLPGFCGMTRLHDQLRLKCCRAHSCRHQRRRRSTIRRLYKVSVIPRSPEICTYQSRDH